MSRRNPLNKRYKKETSPKGVSKKSAASAKPARAQGKGGGAKRSSSRKSSTAPVAKPPLFPVTPEYKQARKWWGITLAGAAILLAFTLMMTFEQVQSTLPLSADTLFLARAVLPWLALGLVGLSWWIDLAQLRPMMKAHQAGISFEEYQKVRAATRAKGKTDREDEAVQ
jgi:hypothetical protein